MSLIRAPVNWKVVHACSLCSPGVCFHCRRVHGDYDTGISIGNDRSATNEDITIIDDNQSSAMALAMRRVVSATTWTHMGTIRGHSAYDRRRGTLSKDSGKGEQNQSKSSHAQIEICKYLMLPDNRLAVAVGLPNVCSLQRPRWTHLMIYVHPKK